MKIIDRWQAAMDSQVGVLFIGLLLILVLMGLAYLFLLWSQKRRDWLTYLYSSHYDRAESLVKEFTFIGEHRADFTVRESVVQMEDRSYGLCLIPHPELATEEVRDRLRCYLRAMEGQKLPLLAPILWKHLDDPLIIVIGGLLQNDSQRLLSVSHYLMDKRLGQAYSEEILIELARTLATLHQTKADNGEPLYHGFLLPRTIHLDFDVNRTINKIVISHAGMAFSMGSHALYEQLRLLKAGKLPVYKHCANEIIEQLSMLAPEQKDQERLNVVGPASDFFAFAALAVLMFTQESFTTTQKVDWSLVPGQWQKFLKACLEESTANRPKDFLELEDWLSDPELALTHRDAEGMAELPEPSSSEEMDLSSLSGMLERVQEYSQENTAAIEGLTTNETDELEKLLEMGYRAQKTSKWEAVHQYASQALEIAPDHPEVNLNMAIASYEMGDLEKAETYYEKVDALNSELAKTFRDHIAFRV